MCYYNSIQIKKDNRITFQGTLIDLPEMTRPVQSGFEYANWPIVKLTQNVPSFELAHWELIAPWLTSAMAVMKGREKFNTLNATSEKLLESKLFKQPALKRRCLVLSSGFFEWRHFTPMGAKKDNAYPYYISLKNKPYFFMAGIYQPWVDIETGEMMNTFSIVTTKANQFMSQIHNKKKRMPTILTHQQAEKWLRPDITEAEIQNIASAQIDDTLLVAHSIKKDFRTSMHPTDPFAYAELPGF